MQLFASRLAGLACHQLPVAEQLELNDRITAAARGAGRDPAEIERSACVLVALEGSRGERAFTDTAPPLTGSAEEIAVALRELGEAGADEAILVVDPISERSIRALGEVVGLLAS